MTNLIEAYTHLYIIASISLAVNAGVLIVLVWDGVKRVRAEKPIDWKEMRKLW
jgi:predicted peroxiredoxin